MEKKILIEGMSCGHCVMHVKNALTELGAANVEVSLKEKMATAAFNSEIDDEKIKLAIEDAGYEVIEILAL